MSPDRRWDRAKGRSGACMERRDAALSRDEAARMAGPRGPSLATMGVVARNGVVGREQRATALPGTTRAVPVNGVRRRQEPSPPFFVTTGVVPRDGPRRRGSGPGRRRVRARSSVGATPVVVSDAVHRLGNDRRRLAKRLVASTRTAGVVPRLRPYRWRSQLRRPPRRTGSLLPGTVPDEAVGASPGPSELLAAPSAPVSTPRKPCSPSTEPCSRATRPSSLATRPGSPATRPTSRATNPCSTRCEADFSLRDPVSPPTSPLHHARGALFRRSTPPHAPSNLGFSSAKQVFRASNPGFRASNEVFSTAKPLFWASKSLFWRLEAPCSASNTVSSPTGAVLCARSLCYSAADLVSSATDLVSSATDLVFSARGAVFSSWNPLLSARSLAGWSLDRLVSPRSPVLSTRRRPFCAKTRLHTARTPCGSPRNMVSSTRRPDPARLGSVSLRERPRSVHERSPAHAVAPALLDVKPGWLGFRSPPLAEGHAPFGEETSPLSFLGHAARR